MLASATFEHHGKHVVGRRTLVRGGERDGGGGEGVETHNVSMRCGGLALPPTGGPASSSAPGSRTKKAQPKAGRACTGAPGCTHFAALPPYRNPPQ